MAMTSEKAKEILSDGTVHKKPLTPKQKRFFGWIAGGRKRKGTRVVGTSMSDWSAYMKGGK